MTRLLLIAATIVLTLTRAFAAFPQIAVKPLCLDQLQSPTNITNAGDGSGRLFITEQRGKIMIFKNGMLQPTPFLDIGAKLVPPPGAYDERGLLGMAFHPDHANPAKPGYRRFYLFYNAPSPNVVGTSNISTISIADPCTITTTAAHNLRTDDRVQLSGVANGAYSPVMNSGISSMALGNPCEITTAAAHGLQTGDGVTISGVTGGAFSPGINSTYPVTVVDSTRFTVPVNCTSTAGLNVGSARANFVRTFTVTVTNGTQFTIPLNCTDNSGLGSSGRVRPLEPVNCRTVISEFLVSAGDPNVADLASERILFSFDVPQSNHKGGQLEFGPESGANGERYLYFSVGDGGSQLDNDAGHTGGSFLRPVGNLGNGQDKTRLLAKISRIDPLGTNGPGGQYGIPVDNPFVGAGGGVREEIWAYGMRNPWKFSFDPPTGRMFCGDVGQDTIEEIDLVVKGGNYGWHAKEGTRVQDATLLNALQNGGTALISPPNTTTTLPGGETIIDPIGQYAHNGANFGGLPQIGNSVTGGYVYRGSALPALVGKYVFADWGLINPTPNGTLLGLEETSPNVWTFAQLDVVGGNPIPTHVAAFGVDEQGEIYLATKTNTSVVANDPNTGLPAGGLYMIVPPAAGSTTIEASRDNSIYEDATGNSNGQGDLIAGLASSSLAKRRALVAFDFTHALPRGVVVDSAQLSLTTITASNSSSYSLHKLLEDWGEGASSDIAFFGAAAETGDATWTNAIHDPTTPTPWTTAGGEYTPAASASASLAAPGVDTWSGSGLVADVQSWLADSATNFGWLVRDETENVGTTTTRVFASRENTTVANRPRLTLGYTGPLVTRREQWLQQYFAIGKLVNDLGDGDSDGVVEQVEYASGTSPFATNTPVNITATPNGANQTLTVTFRRDPRATDLTYQLQQSNDLANWFTLAESIGGATPSGSHFVSETDIAGEFPLKLVTVQRVVPASANPATRLHILRYEGATLAQTADLTFNPSSTDAPTLTTPATGASVKNPIAVEFNLPRAALPDSVKLIFDNGTTTTTLNLASSQEGFGNRQFSLNPANPTESSEVESIEGGTSIPDGTYTITLSYRDAAGNPAATAVSTNVKIDTIAPTFTTPDGGYAPLILAEGTMFNYVSQSLPSNDTVLVTQSPAANSPTTPDIVLVTLTAKDAAGNEGTTSFNVTIRPAAAVHVKFIGTGDAAPDAGTMGIPGGPPAGATLTSLGVPCIDNLGEVSYLAKWTGSTGRSSGLFHDNNCLIGIGGDAAPVVGAKIKTLSDPVGSDDHVALLATLSGVPKGKTAAVLSNADGGRTPLVIAQSGTDATADGAKFKSFKSVAVEGDYTAFLAQLAAGTGTTPRTSAATDLGLWVKDGADPLVLVLREGQMIGNKTIKTIVSFAPGSSSAGQGRGWLRELPAVGVRLLALVIFKEAKAQAVVEVDTTNVANPVVLSETGVANATGSPSIDDATFVSYGLPAAGTLGRSAFLGSLAVNPALTISRADARGIFANDAGRYEPLARVGRDAGVNSAKFSVLKDPIVTSDGGLAFPATLKGGTARGLAATTLWWQPPSEPLGLLAQGGAEPGDLPDAQWKSFTTLAAAANRGPLFAATLVPGKGGVTKATANGVWAMDFKGDLRLLFRAGVTQIDLGGATGMQTVKSFTLLKALPGSAGVTRSFNDAQQVVWLATFANKTQAIVTTVVP